MLEKPTSEDYRNDPLLWIHDCWPDMVLYDKQAAIIKAVQETPEVFCHSAHELGKTRTAALIALHWVSTRFPARTIVSSSSERQLLGALWPEVVTLMRTSKIKLGMDQSHLELRMINKEDNKPFPEHFARFMVTNHPESFQGTHLPMIGDIPRILIIFDEASGVDDVFYDAAQTQAHRLLAISNPLSTDGFFYRMCKKGDAENPDEPGQYLRRVYHIDGDESPNVIAGKAWQAAGNKGSPPVVVPGLLTWQEYRRRERIWDEIKRKIRLHGHFHEGDETLMFPPVWLDAAEDQWADVMGYQRGPFCLGVDVAEGGRDLSVWYVIDWLGVMARVTKRTKDTSVIGPMTLKLMGEYRIPARRVCFDRGAGGKQHADYLRQKGIRVRAIGFGEGSNDPKTFKNKRIEMYALLRKAIDPSHWIRVPGEGNDPGRWTRCFAIPPEGDKAFTRLLREELAILPVIYDPEGKQYLPPKSKQKTAKGSRIKTLDEMLGRSPDHADALALAVYARDGASINRVVRIDKDRVMAPDFQAADRATAMKRLTDAELGGMPGDGLAANEPPRTLADRLFGPTPSGRSGMGW